MGEDDNSRLPGREAVLTKLRELLEGNCSREEAAFWASKWIVLDDPDIEDYAVWDALSKLAGADTPTVDRPYLFENIDFEEWLRELLIS